MKRYDAKSIWRCNYCSFEYLAPIKGTLGVSGFARCPERKYPYGCKMRRVAGE